MLRVRRQHMLKTRTRNDNSLWQDAGSGLTETSSQCWQLWEQACDGDAKDSTAACVVRTNGGLNQSKGQVEKGRSEWLGRTDRYWIWRRGLDCIYKRMRNGGVTADFTKGEWKMVKLIFLLLFIVFLIFIYFFNLELIQVHQAMENGRKKGQWGHLRQ